MNNIVLIGMMGAGKSTVGKLLAQALNADFVDADTEIQKHQNTSIEALFKTLGEPGFRDVEHQVLTNISVANNSQASSDSQISSDNQNSLDAQYSVSEHALPISQASSDRQNSPPMVLATGGGCVTHEKNRHVLEAIGTIIYLEASQKTIVERVKADTTVRPLLSTENIEETVAQLLKQRQAIYREWATFTIDTSNNSAETITSNILAKLKA